MLPAGLPCPAPLLCTVAVGAGGAGAAPTASCLQAAARTHTHSSAVQHSRGLSMSTHRCGCTTHSLSCRQQHVRTHTRKCMPAQQCCEGSAHNTSRCVTILVMMDRDSPPHARSRQYRPAQHNKITLSRVCVCDYTDRPQTAHSLSCRPAHACGPSPARACCPVLQRMLSCSACQHSKPVAAPLPSRADSPTATLSSPLHSARSGFPASAALIFWYTCSAS